ncbi:MAG TPA: 2OG-Fe dioxygenase family protein [Myxococcota bacterium]|nr:2OG-Fe dioxygenase family protein [Myxococcota bacterium]
MSAVPSRLLDASSGAADHIQLISLETLNINRSEFLAPLEGSFASLPLDLYDQRTARFRFLEQRLTGLSSRLAALFPRYHAGELADAELEPFLAALSDDDREHFFRIQPFRRRAMDRYELERTESGTWHIHTPAQTGAPFLQSSGNAHPDSGDYDYRGLPRLFAPISPALTQTAVYRRFLCGVADCVYASRPGARMTMFVHHMHTFVTPEQNIASNTPEGIHQDGSDFIVSAFVVERHHVEGGESRIYVDKGNTLIFRTQLDVGQGLIQPDLGTPLWHELTPLRLSPSTSSYGFRSIIGIDIDFL